MPVAFFQALGRTERDSSQSDTTKSPDHDSGFSDASTTAAQTPAQSQRNSKASGGKSGAMVYGIVMYDFQAERADELEAKAGEAIIVIAQSNPEWFVAKPIGRLGGPGLIPVSFVEIRDMASNTPVPNPQESIRRAGIPRVEEWKKMAAEYKNSSITLGKFEMPNAQQGLEQGMERMSLQSGSMRQSQQMGGGAGMVSPPIVYWNPRPFLAPVEPVHVSANALAYRDSKDLLTHRNPRKPLPRLARGRLPSFTHLSRRGYRSTVSPRRSTGSSSKRCWKTAVLGSSPDITKISTTSRSPSSQSSRPRQGTLAPRSVVSLTCLALLTT